ncbi:MAG: helix-turn-helix domain-containing protein [Halobacteriales archaeon]|nr:helix-turn-helix domain-containing protein [Halobacteriales archaeon]
MPPSETTTDGTLITDETLVENTALEKLLGESAHAKVLSVLIMRCETDHSVSDIAEMAGVDRSTIYRYDILEDLREVGAVEKTREVGNSPMYKLDTDTAVGEHLAGLSVELIG